jgi:hypothetical protein
VPCDSQGVSDFQRFNGRKCLHAVGQLSHGLLGGGGGGGGEVGRVAVVASLVDDCVQEEDCSRLGPVWRRKRASTASVSGTRGRLGVHTDAPRPAGAHASARVYASGGRAAVADRAGALGLDRREPSRPRSTPPLPGLAALALPTGCGHGGACDSSAVGAASAGDKLPYVIQARSRTSGRIDALDARRAQ